MPGLIFSVITIFFSAFEYRGSGVPQLFPYALASVDYSVPGIYANPSLLTTGEGFTIATYGCRPYSESGLHSYSSGIRYSAENWGTQFCWRSFGTGFYRENTFTLSAGFAPVKSIHAGVSVSTYLLNIDAGEDRFSDSMNDADLSLTIAPFRWLDLSFIQTNSSVIFSEKNSGALYHEWSAGALLKPFSGFSLSYNITGADSEKVSTYMASVVPARFLCISGGYSTGCSQFAASFTVILRNFNVSYGLSYHPYLGSTHSFGAAFSTQVMPEPLQYGVFVNRTAEKKVNINKASDEEIKNIPGLSSKSSGRVILYRDKIGQVTEKSLVQIGLSADEIESLRLNTYGLARNPRADDEGRDFKAKKKKYSGRKYLPAKERVKRRFRLLIKTGIPAHTAIRYSEMPESAESDEIEPIVEADRTLTDEQKRAVLEVCAE